MTCATCASWQLKDSSMARHGFAPCAHGPRWESLPDCVPACKKHSQLDAAKTKARTAWLAGPEKRRSV